MDLASYFDLLAQKWPFLAAPLAIISGSIAGFYKVFLPAVRKVTPTFSKFNILLESAEIIKKELSPNGGTSIRDAISRIENGLAIQVARTRVLANNESEAYLETDESGKVQWVNNNLVDVAGLSFDDCLGDGWISAIQEEDRERFIEHWHSAIEQARFFNIDNVAFGLKSPIKVKMRAHILRDRTGKLVGWFGIIAKDASIQEKALVE